jgi:hypothetical protein
MNSSSSEGERSAAEILTFENKSTEDECESQSSRESYSHGDTCAGSCSGVLELTSQCRLLLEKDKQSSSYKCTEISYMLSQSGDL